MANQFIKVAAIAPAGFFRLGRHWPAAGEIVPVAGLSEDELRRLTDDPNLRVTAADGPVEPVGSDDLKTLLKGAIAALGAEDFQKDGKPKLDALKAALPDHKDQINAAIRDEVWA